MTRSQHSRWQYFNLFFGRYTRYVFFYHSIKKKLFPNTYEKLLLNRIKVSTYNLESISVLFQFEKIVWIKSNKISLSKTYSNIMDLIMCIVKMIIILLHKNRSLNILQHFSTWYLFQYNTFKKKNPDLQINIQ